MTSHEGLDALLTLLRRHGVRRYASGAIEVVFAVDGKATAEPALRAPDAPVEAHDASPTPRCPCGHDVEIEHNEAGCLRGCAEELCGSADGEVEP